jgi:hypothetical protein
MDFAITRLGCSVSSSANTDVSLLTQNNRFNIVELLESPLKRI